MKKLCFLSAAFFLQCSIFGQNIVFSDANFKNQLLHTNCAQLTSPAWLTDVDVNNDGEIQVSEAQNVLKLNVSTNEFNTSGNIASLAGLESFTNLTDLNCKGNSIASLDVSAFSNLINLECSYNQLTSLDVSGLTNLADLRCNKNQINQLNLSGLTNLKLVFCIYNNLSAVDLSGLTALENFQCDGNQISNFTFGNNGALKLLSCSQNLLTSLDLQAMPNLLTLWAESNAIASLNFTGLNFLDMVNVTANSLTQIDASQAPHLNHLFCSDNPNLTTINVRNNYLSWGDPDLLDFPFRFDNLPNILSICMDDGEQNYLINTLYNSNANVQIFGGANCDIPLTISTNSTSDFDLNNGVVLYPNPIKNIVTVETKNNAQIQSIQLYNALGQLVKTHVVPIGKSTTLDVSSLKPGTYFMRINSDHGKTSKKFVKI